MGSGDEVTMSPIGGCIRTGVWAELAHLISLCKGSDDSLIAGPKGSPTLWEGEGCALPLREEEGHFQQKAQQGQEGGLVWWGAVESGPSLLLQLWGPAAGPCFQGICPSS